MEILVEEYLKRQILAKGSCTIFALFLLSRQASLLFFFLLTELRLNFPATELFVCFSVCLFVCFKDTR